MWLLALVLVVFASVWIALSSTRDLPPAHVVERSPELDPPRDSPEVPHEGSAQVGRRSVVGNEHEATGVSLVFTSGAPASGLRVFGVERGGGGPAREIVEGSSRLIGKTSEAGVIPLSDEFARDSLQGVAVAVSPGCAVIFPVARFAEGATIEIADPIEQELEVVFPEGPPNAVGESVVLQCESRTEGRFSAPWKWGLMRAPSDFFPSHHLESTKPILERCYYSAVAVEVRRAVGAAQVSLSAVPSRVFAVDMPLGYELIEDDAVTSFVPGSDPLSVRLRRLLLRTVQVRSKNGELWPAPSSVFLARKAVSVNGEWFTKWEMRLESEESDPDAHMVEFCVPSEHEEGAASIIVEYGGGLRLESEMYQWLPEHVEIRQ